MTLRALLVAFGVGSIAVGAIAACGGDDDPGGAAPTQDSGTSSADNFVPPNDSGGGGGDGGGDSATVPSGTIDPTFGDGGLVTLGSNIPSSETPVAVLRQSDGKLLVVGTQSETSGAFIVRLTTAGALDATFGIGGKLLVEGGYVYSAALQADGKILVGRFTNILRLNADGSVDKTFGDEGRGLIDDMTPNTILPLADGTVLVAGVRPNVSIGFTLARLTSAGVKDNAFDSDGYAETTAFSGNSRAYSIAVDSSGRYVVSGELFGTPDVPVARYLSTGALDDAFGTNGQVTITMPGNGASSIVAIQNDGKILVAGKSGTSCVTFRLSGTDGALDTSFGAADGGTDGGTAGIVTGPSCGSLGPTGLALRTDGKILVAKSDGWFQRLSDGSLDSAFGTAGVAPLNTETPKLPTQGSMYAMALQPDETIVGVGAVNNTYGTSGSAWRGTATGAIDTTFGTSGQTTFPFYARPDEIRSIDVLPNDSVLAAGEALIGVGLVRFGKDGAFDTTFGSSGWAYLASGQVAGVKRDANGRIFVAAEQYVYARTSEGLPTPFPGDAGVTMVQSPNLSEWFIAGGMGIDSAGRPIVAGRGGGTGATTLVVARMTTAGVQDTSFGAANGNAARTAYQRANTFMSAALVQPDGKTLVGGFDGEGKGYVLRVDANGALDASFGGGYVTLASFPGVTSMALQADGKIVVAGGTTLARLDANGTLDASFGQGGVSTAVEATDVIVDAVRVRSDGKIFAAGSTKILNGKRSMAVARVSSTGVVESTTATSFASNDARAFDIGFQSNGAVILGGYVADPLTDHDFALVRIAP